MKAQELRIGNWVYNYDGVKFQVEAQHIVNQEHANNASRPFSYFDPILITPELLEKAGFEDWTSEDKYHYTLEYVLEPISDFYINGRIAKGESEIKISFGTQGNCCGFDGEPKTMYLHQLQNLYFALTNNELQIQP